MKKQVPQTITSNDKLGFKTETLRRMSESLTPEQLKEVAGGQRCTSNSGTSSI